MRKIKSSFTIMNLLLSFFIVLQINSFEVVAESVCCEKTGESYCIFTDDNYCEDGRTLLDSSKNYKSYPFGCLQVDVCQDVCCIDSTGVCTEGTSRLQCLDEGGKIGANGPSCTGVSQCTKGCCVVDQQCSCDITAAECKKLSEEFDVPFEFKPDIVSEKECRMQFSREEGCCVGSDGCSRTEERSCEGEFYRGMLCSNNELAGVCSCDTQDSKICGSDGEDVYWKDSCGNVENVVGVLNDGFIHDRLDDISGAVGDCDYMSGTICRQKGLDAYCEDLNCRVGDEYTAEEYVPSDGELLSQTYIVGAEELGGKTTRLHGESWCVKPDNTLKNPDAPGSRHYVFSCIKGQLNVEGCGVFRDEICESDGGVPENAFCRDNEWEACMSCGQDGGKPFTTDCRKYQCESLGDCVYDDEGLLNTAECWPKYPPGFEFWKNEGEDASPNERMCSNNKHLGCGEGGDAWWNSCDPTECVHLGDCGEFDGGWSTIQGLAVGAAAGYLSGEAILAILPVANGPLAELLGVGSSAGGAAKTAKGAVETAGKTKSVVDTAALGRQLFGDEDVDPLIKEQADKIGAREDADERYEDLADNIGRDEEDRVYETEGINAIGDPKDPGSDDGDTEHVEETTLSEIPSSEPPLD